MKKILFLIFLFIPNIAHADITTGLIAWINPVNATDPIADSSGNSNVMNLINTPTFTTGPNGLGALNMLGGSPQLGFINYVSAFNSSVGTWSFWINTTSNTGSSNYTMMDMANSGGSLNGVNFFMGGSNGQIVMNVKDGASMSIGCGTNAGVNDGNWHLITGTWSQSNGGTISCYQDSVFISSATVTNNWAFDGTQPITFNYSNDTFWQRADASYADVRVYTRILSVNDIKQLYVYPNSLPSGIKINNAKINNSKFNF